jgi:hypothetical protein
MTIDVDTVCTDAELDEFLGGALTRTLNMLPGEWADSEPARAYALRRTLQSLERRTPPVFEQDISDVTELHDAVVFGACARLYDLGITSAGESEVMFHQARRYEQKFRDEVASLVLTGPTNERIASRAPSIFRR